jgi:hypothetical protein
LISNSEGAARREQAKKRLPQDVGVGYEKKAITALEKDYTVFGKFSGVLRKSSGILCKVYGVSRKPSGRRCKSGHMSRRKGSEEERLNLFQRKHLTKAERCCN